MIINLNKGEVTINTMVVPEPIERLHVQYKFESKTDHLLPRMIIGTDVFIGDNIFINLKRNDNVKNVDIKVDLLDVNGNIVREYKGTFQYSRYCILGRKPVCPDLDDYVHKLKMEIKQLKEKGEVI